MKWRASIMMAAGMLAAAATIAAAAGKGPAKGPAKSPSPAEPPLPRLNYDVVNEFKIGGVGQWHSAVLDTAGKYLYIPRMTHTQVIDTGAPHGAVVADIPGHSAWGIALVPDVNRGFITNIQQGTVTVFDLKTNAVFGDIAVGANPSDIIYDPASKRVLVCCGPSSVVPLSPDIDVKTGKADPAVTFDGQVHGIIADGQGMVYVTVQDKNFVAVLDTRTMTIATHFPVGAWHTPAAMAMDRVHSRLFVCCGSKLGILSASDGHILDELVMRQSPPWKFPAATAAYYDGHVFGVCGDGTMTILGQKQDGDFAEEDMIKVEPNSQPIVIDPNSGKIYLPTEQMDNRKPVPETFKVLVLQKK